MDIGLENNLFPARNEYRDPRSDEVLSGAIQPLIASPVSELMLKNMGFGWFSAGSASITFVQVGCETSGRTSVPQNEATPALQVLFTYLAILSRTRNAIAANTAQRIKLGNTIMDDSHHRRG